MTLKKFFFSLMSSAFVLLNFFMGVIQCAYRGLLASKMYMTAKAIVANLISLIDTYGYVLNCARAYCTNRR